MLLHLPQRCCRGNINCQSRIIQTRIRLCSSLSRNKISKFTKKRTSRQRMKSVEMLKLFKNLRQASKSLKVVKLSEPQITHSYKNLKREETSWSFRIVCNLNLSKKRPPQNLEELNLEPSCTSIRYISKNRTLNPHLNNKYRLQAIKHIRNQVEQR